MDGAHNKRIYLIMQLLTIFNRTLCRPTGCALPAQQLGKKGFALPFLTARYCLINGNIIHLNKVHFDRNKLRLLGQDEADN
uniref:Uncharacterized protein n=1 Tax=Vibrio sp. FF_307 TaxID=1652834 RepID=A0A0H3ZT56_9VIBR|nr:hypothetical protein [Vibrio sp. FF_307]